ncbi:hypothetical protein D9758_003338 [Tetrapyrgos nigripes]|uniref:Uncharacterized protein n=1 Tax=Tetrapyrgos nigripes TaxID=182062 RepID=A0A8H5GIS9_9AGAR|nr:hypothetical protein D9758_003338 [Tetrapyrgos nigripes]
MLSLTRLGLVTYLPQYQEPPIVVSEVQYETQTMTVTETRQVPPPANTRQVAFPTPEVVASYSTTFIPRTTAVEIITEEEEEEEEYVPVARPRATRRPPVGAGGGGWFGGW